MFVTQIAWGKQFWCVTIRDKSWDKEYLNAVVKAKNDYKNLQVSYAEQIKGNESFFNLRHVSRDTWL